MPKERIDKLVVDRGLAESRTRAQALILAGQILVGEQRTDKPGQMVDSSLEIRVRGGSATPKYVSRGGLKLEAALRDFGIAAEGKTCLDVGASTGGFTDCLLQHNAREVWAIDVGHNQLAWKIRQDPRVVVIEGQNARVLVPDQFPTLFDLATIDVSFISVLKILPQVAECMAVGADVICLAKPQFEVGRGEVGKGGIVSDPLKHRRVLEKVVHGCREAGLVAHSVMESPIRGAQGNREFLVHLRKSSTSPEATVSEIVIRQVVSLTAAC